MRYTIIYHVYNKSINMTHTFPVFMCYFRHIIIKYISKHKDMEMPKNINEMVYILNLITNNDDVYYELK